MCFSSPKLPSSIHIEKLEAGESVLLSDPKVKKKYTTEKKELIPAVPIEDSIQEDFIVCLEDGKKLKSLTRYLSNQYGMSKKDYLKKWNLPSDYHFECHSTARTKKQAAVRMNITKKAKKEKEKTKRKTINMSYLYRKKN